MRLPLAIIKRLRKRITAAVRDTDPNYQIIKLSVGALSFMYTTETRSNQNLGDLLMYSLALLPNIPINVNLQQLHEDKTTKDSDPGKMKVCFTLAGKGHHPVSIMAAAKESMGYGVEGKNCVNVGL